MLGIFAFKSLVPEFLVFRIGMLGVLAIKFVLAELYLVLLQPLVPE